MELVKQLLIKLRKNWYYKILICFTVIYTFYITNNLIYYTNYQEGDITLIGYITEINYGENKIDLTIKAKEKIKVTYYCEEQLNYQLGDYIKVSGTLTKPYNNTIFNLFNYRKYLLSEKIYFILNADEITKVKDNQNIFYYIKNKIYQKMADLKTKAYVQAFVLGDNQDLDEKIKTVYQENGITHLLAVSGSHTTFLASFLLLFFKRFKKSHIIISFILLFYAFLTNFTPSILRAVFLFIFNKYDKKQTIILIFCFMLLYNPYYIYNVGFLFSFVICFYLIYFNNLINKFNNYLIKLLVTSFICFVASIPILINNFYYINLISPFINLIFIPFVTFIIFPLCLIVLFFPCLDNILYLFINIMEQLSLFCNNFNINLIMCKVNIFLFVFYYIIITFVFIKPKYFYLLIIIIVIHTNIKYFNHNIYLTMIDVGQGDSILLELKNKNILIDTGGNSFSDYNIAINKLIPYFKSLGIKKIDYLILTHGDYDHLGESVNLINNFKISKVIFNNDNYNELESEIIKILNDKKIKYYQNIKQLNIHNNVLYFLNDEIYDNENDNSIILYTELNGSKLLLMGDAGTKVENKLMAKYNLMNISVLKVGHHGSKTSSSSKFIDYIQPKYSVISVGKNNWYNHPHVEVLNNLNKSDIYRTDKQGSIKFNFRKNKIKITTSPP